DMVHKCARMRIPIVLSRTAPSSLGIAIAARAGLTLAGYGRQERLNVFTHPERVVLD
ncbi:MAG: formate dehydrogenase accessory sulfurtransferase FdhD, partial [Desulfofustis sp.]|nr:formate dehydrogenase accessory sulfurtransferase FdhD [Desulfofustis sp.]